MRRTMSIMIGVVLLLSTIGIVMLASTSAAEAAAKYNDAYYFLKRQSLYLFIGLAAMTAASYINCDIWRRYVWFIAFVTLALLAMTATPGIGLHINGSRRWLRAGPITVQASELGKFAVIVVAAWWVCRRPDLVRDWKYSLLAAGMLLIPFIGLVAVEPDFGTTLLLACAAFTVLFVAGAPLGPLAIGGTLGVIGLSFLIMLNANRMERILAFLDPDKYEKTYAYQLRHAEYAFVAGGFGGVGFGESLQKQFYLPEAYADFIFPIIGEEKGLPATLFVVSLYIAFFVCGLIISRNAHDSFRRLVAFGITSLITLQAAFNIAVVTGCVPTKGLPLPFISYGGSSLVVTLFMVGVLAGIARETEAERAQRLPAIKDRARYI